MLGIPNTYSPEDIQILINEYVVTDLAQDSFVEINRNSPNFQHVPGIRGKGSRKHLRDKSGTIILRILQTSNTNNVLSTIARVDQETQAGVLALTIRDLKGDSSFQFLNCYITGEPNIVYSGSSTVAREWIINYEYVSDYYVGGNAKSPLDILSS